jgi:glycosyltransferase involved in cell wall biosynthesis
MEFTRSYGRSALRELEKLNDSDPVDVVHLHCPMISWSESQFRRCSDKVAPVVSSLHGSWLGERDGLIAANKAREAAVWANPNDLAILLTAGRYARFERAAIHESSICVANSHATKADFEERYGPPESWSCEVIHWGVDTSMFHPIDSEAADQLVEYNENRLRYGASEDGSKLILAVGRLAARKGFGTLLRGFAKLQEKAPEASLVIVGRGHLRRRLQRQASRLGIGDKVTIEPGMPFERLASLFRSADLVVYPSFYEGQGLIPLEAMSSGTPVVTVDDGPLPEMVDTTVGALFSMGDIDSMSDSMESELRDDVARRKKGELGRERVMSSFTYEGNAESFESVYSRVVS